MGYEPSIPHAQARKSQNVPTTALTTAEKTIHFVRFVKRRDLKMKWSRRLPTMRTENHSVGSWNRGRGVSEE